MFHVTKNNPYYCDRLTYPSPSDFTKRKGDAINAIFQNNK